LTDRPAEPEAPIRVYLVDDHGIVRKGMRAYLEMVEGIEVMGEAATGEAAVEELDRLAGDGRAPDVVMMDLLMPGMDGITATGLIRERHPEIDVVALTSFVAQDKVQAALAAGASGYVLKDADADEIAAAIRAAYSGQVHLAPAAARELAKGLRLPASRPGADPLTERERQVLTLVAEGASNRTIAEALFISERTARTHVSNILMKLGLRSRTQAALWAIREGFAAGSD